MTEYLIEYFTGSQRATLYYSSLNANYIYQVGKMDLHPNIRGKTLTSPIGKRLSEIQEIQGNFKASAGNEPFYYSELNVREPTVYPSVINIVPAEVQTILTKFDNKELTFIAFDFDHWFQYDTNSVRNGTINSQDFLNAYNGFVNRELIIDKTIPVVTLSSEVQAILTKFDNNDYTYPSWFNSNIGYVKDGSITSNEFLAALNNLLQAGTIIDETIIEPEPITYCVNIYTLDSGGNVLSDHYDKMNLQNLQNLLSENKYVIQCKEGIIPSEQQVRTFYGYTAPVEDSSINSMMVSQSVGAFILKDGRLKGEILYIANTAFNPFYYGKSITSLVQIKSKTGIPIAVKPNNLNFTNTQRDERIQIDEAVGNFKELIVDFFVWKSTTDLRAFTANKQIQVVEELPPPDEPDFKPCPIGYHKDFSGKCVLDDPLSEIPRDKLIDTLKGFLFGTVALSLLARKY